jgi:hypothetical protein
MDLNRSLAGAPGLLWGVRRSAEIAEAAVRIAELSPLEREILDALSLG